MNAGALPQPVSSSKVVLVVGHEKLVAVTQFFVSNVSKLGCIGFSSEYNIVSLLQILSKYIQPGALVGAECGIMHAVDGAKPHQIQNPDSALRLPTVRLSSLKISPQIDALIYDWHRFAFITAEVFTVLIFQGLLCAAKTETLSKCVKHRCQLPDPWTSACSTTASCQLALSALHSY